MKKIASLFMLFTLFFTSCKTQMNKVIYSQKENQKILIGEVNRNAFDKKPFKSWFTTEYNNYKPNPKIIKQLQNSLPSNSHIVIIFATWCPDSRREVPRFLKILDLCNYDMSKVKMYAVDRNFKAGNIDLSKYHIKKVPTFIYSHYGYEAGRIIEKPVKSLEADLLFFTHKK